jgi:predicted Zn-ribbon and HTH transcriptional regulator
MFRKDLIPMLLNNPMSAKEIARSVLQKDKDTLEDLEHLIRSLKHTEYKAVIQPATCKKCGFEFGPEKLGKPSRCPKCKSTWIQEARISITT